MYYSLQESLLWVSRLAKVATHTLAKQSFKCNVFGSFDLGNCHSLGERFIPLYSFTFSLVNKVFYSFIFYLFYIYIYIYVLHGLLFSKSNHISGYTILPKNDPHQVVYSYINLQVTYNSYSQCKTLKSLVRQLSSIDICPNAH